MQSSKRKNVERSSRHPQIEENLDNPGRKRYKEKELSYALMTNARTFGAHVGGRLNRQEISILRSPIPDVTSKPELLELALVWFDILDKAFFFKILRNGMRRKKPIVIYHDEEQKVDGYCSCLGPSTYISLNIFRSRTRWTEGSAGECIIDTLTHEMLHGFLHIFSCTCKHCGKRSIARKGGCGISGHGANWCNAMDEIESAIQKQVQWNVDAGIAENLAIEMKSSGWQPRDDQVERWQLDGIELAELADDSEEFERRLICYCNIM
ncbi:hypothetical protein BKA65DRAFT_486158 [Rhexocercosporidium sp. MPI-PUGE-AT-0058]|nr:hypothetical protein BKA65DRAFT_486158 [Rhexocercosporidium sp. MPI-PUGE-AT-0058]